MEGNAVDKVPTTCDSHIEKIDIAMTGKILPIYWDIHIKEEVVMFMIGIVFPNESSDPNMSNKLEEWSKGIH